MPTAAMKSGTFSELRGAIYFPNADGTRTAFPNNIIPAAQQNAAGRKLASLFPRFAPPGAHQTLAAILARMGGERAAAARRGVPETRSVVQDL